MRRNIWISNEAEEVLEKALDGKPLSKFISEAILKANNNTQQGETPITKPRKRRDVCMLRERDFVDSIIETVGDNVYHLHECGEFRSTQVIASDCDVGNDVLVEELKRLVVEVTHTERIIPFFVYKLKDEEKIGHDSLIVFFNESLTVAMVCEGGMSCLSHKGYIPHQYAEDFGDLAYKADKLSDACQGMEADYDKFDIVQ